MTSKYASELAFWSQAVADVGGDLRPTHRYFQHFYTEHFGLTPEFYAGKKILDIGCGPAGSLEWADMAAERIGLDPLADSYRMMLNANQHKMQYVAAPSEAIPYPTSYFDVVCSFNSFDHVDDIYRTTNEIKRVLAVGGLFLLLTEIHPFPTINEPQVFNWGVVKLLTPELELLTIDRFEKHPMGLYQSLWLDLGCTVTPFDGSNPTKRYGVLSAKFVKR